MTRRPFPVESLSAASPFDGGERRTSNSGHPTLSPVNPRGKQTQRNRTGGFARCVLIAATVGAAAGCSESGPMEITGERPLAVEYQEILIVESSAERFRAQGASDGAGDISFDYDLPEGWAEVPRSSMRMLNFAFGENGEGECYLAILAGDSGGLEANVNRWRGQMGLEPAGADEIASLPTKKLFGRDAVFISLDGDFRGFGAPEPQKDYRMLGLIMWNDELGGVFAKMTGPRELVKAHAEKFDAFCGSVRPM